MATEIIIPYKWKPRNYQLPAWDYFFDDEEGKRGVCMWHRRAGKDLFAINLIASKIFRRPGLYWHLLPTYKQGRSIVWNGFTREGRSFLDHFPPSTIERKLGNEMQIHFKNGSIYQVVGTDDVDTLVGTNPIGVVFSEYSLQDPAAWRFLSPILRENGGWGLFIYTMRGKNHGYRLYQMALKNDDWFSELLVAGDNGTKRDNGEPVISDEQIDKDRQEGMPEEIILQEYYNSADAPLVGAYYSDQMQVALEQGRITTVNYDPKLHVDTSWDIGVGDSTAIVFSQSYGMEHRIIDYYENSGEGLPHYVKILQEKGYLYGKHFAPWDIKVREFTSGQARIETAAKLGVKFTVTQKHIVDDGIEAVRNILPKCWFDSKKCEQLLEGLRSYRKEFDSKKQLFTRMPVHDWASHPADAFRYFAWNMNKTRITGQLKPQEVAIDDYEYF